MRELVLGCGSTSEQKTITVTGSHKYENPTTLDLYPRHNPDVIWDLASEEPLPFDDNTFDEIHAYEILEHIGAQGDYKTLFRQFSDYWRVLKPNGFLMATVPHYQSILAWGEPSHTRIINAATLVFLSQAQYEEQIGKTAMSDFRDVYKADFNPAYMETIYTDKEGEDPERRGFHFVLQAVKPSRIKE